MWSFYELYSKLKLILMFVIYKKYESANDIDLKGLFELQKKL